MPVGKKGGSYGIALGSREANGPFHVGCTVDKHQFIDKNDDKEPVNSLHFDTDTTLWIYDSDKDAPLEFDLKQYGPVSAPIRVRAWLRYDPRSYHTWGGIGSTQTRGGLWRWEAESFVAQKKEPGKGPPNEPEDPPPGGPDDPPNEPRDPTGGGGELGPTEPRDPPTGPKRPDGAHPDPDVDPSGPSVPDGGYSTRDDWHGQGQPGLSPYPEPGHPKRPDGGHPPTPSPNPGGGGIPPGGRPPPAGPGARKPRPQNNKPAGPARYVLQADTTKHNPEGVSLMIGQAGLIGALGVPQHFGRADTDIRYSTAPDGPALRRYMAFTPAVVRIGAWGAQSGQSWTYTQKPGYSRVPGGTASGGFIVMPPEVDEMDAGSSFAPAGVTKSTSYFAWAPGTWASFGVPDFTNGDMTNGTHRIGRDGTSLSMQTRIAGAWTESQTWTWEATDGVASRFLGFAGTRLPMGTTAQRPVSLIDDGMIRFNSDVEGFEGYDGTEWRTIGRPRTDVHTSDHTITADEAGRTFTTEGAAGTVTLTLPACAANMRFTFICGETQTLNITIAGGGDERH